ncbi:MAG: hypothetical protein NZ874_00340 [Fimbriimonadales bacterium]|nr:hypothetical protein [Fimbriimonadales bacterium]
MQTKPTSVGSLARAGGLCLHRNGFSRTRNIALLETPIGMRMQAGFRSVGVSPTPLRGTGFQPVCP